MPPKPFPQQRYPQPQYAPTFCGPLIHAVRRRVVDYQFLPSLADHLQSRPCFQGWGDIQEGVDKLRDALMGVTPFTRTDKANSAVYRCNGVYRPPLEAGLRRKVEGVLMGVEGEAVGLGKDIEMNYARLKRGDPRGKSEEELVALRDQMGKAWLAAIRECVREVLVFQTGKESEPSWEEESALRYRMGRGPREPWGRGGGKL